MKPEVDLERFDRFPVVYAGDLHSFDNCQRNIVYPGTPYSISFHREVLEYGGLMIDTEYWTHERRIWDLPQLIKKVISSEDEIVDEDFDRVIYQIRGNLVDLKNVPKDERVVEKVIERVNTLSIDLQGKSITEEIFIYLTEVLKLEEKVAKEVIKVYHDSTTSSEVE